MLESFKTDSPTLNPFLLVTFADLKKYVYHYWFAFPALVSKPNWELAEDGLTAMTDEVGLRQPWDGLDSRSLIPAGRDGNQVLSRAQSS